MSSDDPQPPTPTTRRGCQFTLVGLFAATTIVAMVAAYGRWLLAPACMFWPGTLIIIILVWSLIRPYWHPHHDSPTDSTTD